MPDKPIKQLRAEIRHQRAEVMARARTQVAKDWAAVEARQAIDAEASREIVRQHRAHEAQRKAEENDREGTGGSPCRR